MYLDSTLKILNLALDASLMRQTAIATNIANSNTAHQTLDVSFEQPFNTELSNPVYQSLRKPPSLDEQIILNLKNSTQYSALIKGLNEKLSIMQLAVQGVNQ